MKTLKKFVWILLATVIVFSGCIDTKFDEPPSNCDQINYTANFPIDSLKALLTGKDTVKITRDLIIEGYVTSTDQYGNFYKELYIQDTTGAVVIMIDLSYMFTKYPVGQKVYVLLKDLYLTKDNDMIEIGNTYEEYGITKVGRLQGEAFIDQHIIKTCENQEVTPIQVKINEINDNYLGRLVILDSVQFTDADTGQTWADAVADPPESKNHTLTDLQDNQITVRTSGYATFANDIVPSGSGQFVAIVGKYSGTYQLYVRSLEDVKFDSPRMIIPIWLTKDFEDGSVFSDGWQQKKVSGNVNWELGTYNNELYTEISNYNNGSHEACETWLISPAFDLSLANNPILNFRNKANYSGPDLEIKISVDYDGVSEPSSATWADLSANLSPGGWAWVNSGDIDLSSFIGNNVHLAFVYKGTSTEGKTWCIDDIIVKDK